MRILVVDDHEVVRRGVVSLLQSQAGYQVCGEAVDGRDAVDKAKSLKPDVIVMDVSMPNLNGLEATRLVRQLVPESEVLILSQHESEEMVRQAFNAGARGYVVKSSIAHQLLSAVGSVARHEPFLGGANSRVIQPSRHVDAQEILQRSAALEQALRENEELYRSTFEHSGIGVAHVSPEGHWLRVNSKLCEIVGYTREELLQLTFQDITYPEDLGPDVDHMHRMVAGLAEKYSLEKRYVRKNGSLVWVNLTVSGVRDQFGQLKHFISVVEDISRRKDAEQARFLLAAIVESADSAIVSKNLNGIITSWNIGAERIFGYTSEEATGKPITLIIPTELRGEETNFLSRLRNGEHIEHYETVRVRKDGRRVFVSLTISPVKDADGKVIGASKIAQDITARKVAEKALQEARAELEQRVNERTAELRHKNAELVQQSSIIRDLSRRLLQIQDEERRRIAREMHDSVGQLLAAMSMNFSHALNDVQKLGPSSSKALFDNAELLEQAIREVRTLSHLLHPPLLDEAGIRSALQIYVEGFSQRSQIAVSLEIPEDLARLPNEIEITLFRIVQESLTNIHRHAESPTASIRLLREEGEITLEISDAGQGIPKSKLQLLNTSAAAGVGINGMRERLRQLGGDLEIQSSPSGTTLKASLPVSQAEAFSERSA